MCLQTLLTCTIIRFLINRTTPPFDASKGKREIEIENVNGCLLKAVIESRYD